MDNTIKCSCCKEEKSLESYPSFYYKGNLRHRKQCRKCFSIKDKIYKEKLKNTPKEIITQKFCSSCQQILPVSNFREVPSRKDGFENCCKCCSSKYSKLRFDKIRNSVKKPIKRKTCFKCKQNKPIKHFHKNKTMKDGFCGLCKNCVLIHRTQKYRPKVREKQNEKLRKDPVYKLIHLTRVRMRQAIKTQSKSASTVKLLGCTGAECMDHLEKLFWPGMDRENHGRDGWVIDHIIPVVSFDKTDPNWQFKAFHYTNLQPLWWEDNEKKYNRLDWTPQESKHELPERLKTTIHAHLQDSNQTKTSCQTP